MFGYLAAVQGDLTPDELGRYRACYCGLCRALQQRHGLLARMTLTYDMTFLILTLGALYEPPEETGTARCAVRPAKPHSWFSSEFTAYGADLNTALAYYNCMDDWNDDKKATRLALAKALEGSLGEIRQRLPRQCSAMEQELAALSRLEQAGCPSADEMAACFGRLMGELFVPRTDDHWAPVLREMGEALGQFIYLMDASLDYESDLGHDRPNPLRAFGGGPRRPQDDYALLTMLMGRCTDAFERLPLVQDLPILRSVLYRGVWQRFPNPNQQEDSHESGPI